MKSNIQHVMSASETDPLKCFFVHRIWEDIGYRIQREPFWTPQTENFLDLFLEYSIV